MTTDFPAVVTAAGHGTRFRPFTNSVPKEMLPLGPTPAIEHVIRECLAAGATEALVVTRPGDAIVPEYAAQLRDSGMPVRAVTEDISYGYGNATPLLTLRHRLADCVAFAVAFGDDVVLGERTTGTNLATMRHQLGDDVEAVVAGQRVDRDETRSFGIIDTHPADPHRATGIRQRPDPATVTEPLAVVSRLILRPSILDTLKPADKARGEVDLGVAVGELASVGYVAAHRITGRWVTVGDPARYYHALRTFWESPRADSTRHPEDL